MFKKIILLLALSCLSPLLLAQESRKDSVKAWLYDIAEDVWTMIVSPNKRLEPTYVFQTPASWRASVDGTAIGSTVRIHSKIHEISQMGDTYDEIDARLNYRLKSSLYKKVGLGGGYGGLTFGYGVGIGNHGAKENKFMNIDLSSTFYSVRVQRYVINQYVEGTLSGDSFDMDYDFVSDKPGQMKDFSIDALYAFNSRKFALTAPYKGKMLQRRSTGSWVASAKYMKGDLALNMDDQFILTMTQGLGRYITRQLAFGGGYSYNLVFFHHDPVRNSSSEGLRNLTLNVTALPMVSLDNWIKAITYQNGEESGKKQFSGHPAFALRAFAALCYSWDRYAVNAQIHHNNFGFTGVTTTIESDGGRIKDEVSTNAMFRDLTAKVQFFVRF